MLDKFTYGGNRSKEWQEQLEETALSSFEIGWTQAEGEGKIALKKQAQEIVDLIKEIHTDLGKPCGFFKKKWHVDISEMTDSGQVIEAIVRAKYIKEVK